LTAYVTHTSVYYILETNPLMKVWAIFLATNCWLPGKIRQLVYEGNDQE